MAAALALGITFLGMPMTVAGGFLSRQTLTPTALGVLPLYPLLFILLLASIASLATYKNNARLHGGLSLAGGLASIIITLLWMAQPSLIAQQVPLYGLMEGLTGFATFILISAFGWTNQRLRYPLLIAGLIAGVAMFLWLNSPFGHSLFPKAEGYYRLMTRAPAGTEAEIITSFNNGLDELNEQRAGIGLEPLEPLESLTGLEGQRLPRKAADAGFRLVTPKESGYGSPIIFLMAGLMAGAGAMLLGRRELKEENDFNSGTVIAVVVALLVPAFAATDFSIQRLIDGWPFLRNFLDRAWPPEIESIKAVAQEMLITIEIALVGTFLAALFAIPLSFLASRNLTQGNGFMRAVFFLTRGFFNIDRGVDTLILALVFVAAVGLGPFAGVLAMAIHSIADLGKGLLRID